MLLLLQPYRLTVLFAPLLLLLAVALVIHFTMLQTNDFNWLESPRAPAKRSPIALPHPPPAVEPAFWGV